MKQITKYRLTSKYLIISMFSLIIILLLSYFIESGFLGIVFMDFNKQDFSYDTKSELVAMLLDQILVWEMLISSSMYYIVYFFPLFAVFPIITFLKERKSYYVLGANRFKAFKKELLKSVMKHSLISALAVSFTFGIYFTVFDYFMYPAIENIGGFTSIFPEGFYHAHPYVVFMFMAFTIYFALSFVFALMACGVALITDKEYLVLLIPVVFYNFEIYLSGILRSWLPVDIVSSVVAFNTFHTTLETFIPVIPILILDTILVFYGINRKRII